MTSEIAQFTAQDPIFERHRFINTAITGASFATGQQVAPSVFDIDIYQDPSATRPTTTAS